MTDIEYITGGLELVDVIDDLWNMNVLYHAQRSIHFREDFPASSFEERVRHWTTISQAGHVRIALAESEECCIGYCVASVTADKKGIIESMYVEESYRNQGIGSELMKQILQWMDEQNAQSKSVFVIHGNERSFSFYQRFGFYALGMRLRQK